MTPLVIVDDFHVEGVAVFPPEADTPLVVDADAPFTLAITGKLFQAVSRRNPEEIKGCCAAELLQLPLGNPLHILGKPCRESAMEELFSFLAGERADHGLMVL